MASSPDHALATKLFGGRGGGVLSFMLRGSMAQTKAFLGVVPKLLISFSRASCFALHLESLAPCDIAHQVCETACGGVPSVSKSAILSIKCLRPLVWPQVLQTDMHHLFDFNGLL